MKDLIAEAVKLTRKISYKEKSRIIKDWGCRHVCFSIFKDAPGEKFPTDDGPWWIMIPDIESDRPIFDGKVQFMIDYWRVAEEPILSAVINNPTWKDAIMAVDSLMASGDGCGVFLENFNVSSCENDVTVIEAVIGS
jgi:hypothetical protein